MSVFRYVALALAFAATIITIHEHFYSGAPFARAKEAFDIAYKARDDKGMKLALKDEKIALCASWWSAILGCDEAKESDDRRSPQQSSAAP